MVTEFPRFAELPVELRLLVWNLVPFPNRVIGMVPCMRMDEKGSGDGSDGPLPDFAYVVQPSHLRVFPLLHVNHEARSVWLSRLVQPERSYNATVPAGQSGGNSTVTRSVLVRFNDPFINYDSDIFAVFAPWKPPTSSILVPAADDHHAEDILPIDPFSGLDRNRIRRAGLTELSHGLESAVHSLAIQQLSALEQFVFIVLGPDPWQKETTHTLGPRPHLRPAPTRALEMRVEDLPRVQCDLWNIDSLAVEFAPFFNTERLRHQTALSPIIRPLEKYIVYVKALLWHALAEVLPPNLDRHEMIETRFDLLEYVFHGAEDDLCPLAAEGSCTVEHRHDDMLDWEPDFTVAFILICERPWSSTAMELGLVCPS